MTAHAAVAVRRSTGWVRWVAECPCGWSESELAGKDAAEAAAAAHNGHVHEWRSVVKAGVHRWFECEACGVRK